jgi:hypothetical protein
MNKVAMIAVLLCASAAVAASSMDTRLTGFEFKIVDSKIVETGKVNFRVKKLTNEEAREIAKLLE